VLGQQMILERAGGLPQDKLNALLHCVLAHHGPDGLPGRRFRTPEALALARLNAVDAAVKGALEHGLE
jgi:3'-5' exoribonuclease